MAETILSLAWSQVDRQNSGHIPSRELPMLIEAINTYLVNPLVNETELAGLTKFSQNDRHQRVYKGEFKTLFNSLLGISFSNAVNLAQVNTRALELEKTNDNLTRDTADNALQPSFKKQWRKYKRLSESQEDEIQYRDDVISSFESREKQDKKHSTNMKQLIKDLERSEEEVNFRDGIIIEREQLIKDKDETIKKLQDQIHSLNAEISTLQTSNMDKISKLEWEKQEKFQNELWSQIQKQHHTITILKQSLTKNTQIPQQYPTNFPALQPKPFISLPFKLNYKAIILSIISLILWFTFISSLRSKEPWYTNTIFEPFFFEMVENAEIDYSYYESRL